MADDELVLGHRDSEWCGRAPILEEDIAFANLALDEIGHAKVVVQPGRGSVRRRSRALSGPDGFYPACVQFPLHPNGRAA